MFTCIGFLEQVPRIRGGRKRGAKKEGLGWEEIGGLAVQHWGWEENHGWTDMRPDIAHRRPDNA
jgi:hypothetical protein